MRILLYSADSYGLGHIRRTISIAESVLRDQPASSALLLTGAPRAHYFSYPARCDYLKLPSVTKGTDGRYTSREIDLTLRETIGLRERLIREAAESFRPDVLLVDHSPLGMGGEVLLTLQALSRVHPTAVRILGMRDVIDEPDAVRESWSRDGVVDVLRSQYNRILVYGQRDVFDPVEAYGIPADVAGRMEFVGYIGRNGSRTSPDALRRRYAPRTGRLVVATVGGGGDGNLLLRTLLEAMEQLSSRAPFDLLAVTGPLMSPAKRARLQERARRIGNVSLLEYSDDIPGLYNASDFVVSMGGYNAVCELAYAGARALIVPRTFPRREQIIRARLLEGRGVVRCLSPEDVTPDALCSEIQTGLDAPRPPRRWGLSFSGLENTARVFKRAADACESARSAARGAVATHAATPRRSPGAEPARPVQACAIESSLHLAPYESPAPFREPHE